MRVLVKLSDKYTGWMGEGYTKPKSRRFLKRWEHKYNRRAAKKLTGDLCETG